MGHELSQPYIGGVVFNSGVDGGGLAVYVDLAGGHAGGNSDRQGQGQGGEKAFHARNLL